MIRRALVLLILAACTACARLPAIVPDNALPPTACETIVSKVYPAGGWQLFHAITATVPGGGVHRFTGVAVFSSRTRRLQCSLMTTEGFVLFSGQRDTKGRITIDRTVPPFDRNGFAEGLLNDLALLLLAPEGRATATGRDATGEAVCRWTPGNGRIVDVSDAGKTGWAIRVYAEGKKLERSVTARHLEPVGAGTVVMPRQMTLTRIGLVGYTLELTLLEAIPLPPDH